MGRGHGICDAGGRPGIIIAGNRDYFLQRYISPRCSGCISASYFGKLINPSMRVAARVCICSGCVSEVATYCTEIWHAVSATSIRASISSCHSDQLALVEMRLIRSNSPTSRVGRDRQASPPSSLSSQISWQKTRQTNC